MYTIITKRKKVHPFFKSSENKWMFVFINVYLTIGMESLVITIFYLLGHLNITDRIIYFCIPGFILGISSVIIYFIGYQSIYSDKKRTTHSYRLIGRNS